MLNQLKSSLIEYPNKQLLEQIAIELTKLCELRSEKFNDYNFELWLDRMNEKEMTYLEILEFIEIAKDLPKLGNNLLSFGDVYYRYEKKKEEGNKISWTDFLNKLAEYQKENLRLLKLLTGDRYFTIQEYMQHRAFYSRFFQYVWGAGVDAWKEKKKIIKEIMIEYFELRRKRILKFKRKMRDD